MNYLILLVATFALLQLSYGLVVKSFILTKSAGSSSSLFAHHPEKKIIRKIMDRRPKKHRLSDINRKNVNLNKCITKIENAPPEYTIISAEEFEKVRAQALSFWENGSPVNRWIEITEEDQAVTFSQNIEPLPVGGVQKKPNLVRSGKNSASF